MYSVFKGYKKVSEYAKTMTTKKGKKGVGRAYIYQLIEQEKKTPGSTGLDIVDIDGVMFIRCEEEAPQT